MYLAGVSVRRVEDITEALLGTRVSPSKVSELNKKIYGTIETWRNRPIEVEHPYVYLGGIVLKRSWAGEVCNVSLPFRPLPLGCPPKVTGPFLRGTTLIKEVGVGMINSFHSTAPQSSALSERKNIQCDCCSSVTTKLSFI